ncbi:hypothetical protein AcV7_006382 [Taiwanofungus camphoratus]|nr:hypothetical protein AcV7_006382 [Antrodia cinnamomea]
MEVHGGVDRSAFHQRPFLYIYDPKALHTLVVKDVQIYEKSKMFIKSNLLLFGPGLLSTLGDHHRAQRKMLNPVFNVNHMRHMLPIFYDIIHQLRAAIASQVKDGPREIDMLGWTGRTALELIGQGGLGYSFDPLVETVEDTYGDALRDLLPTMIGLHLFRQLVPYVCDIGPVWFRRMIMDWFPNKQVQKAKSIVDTLTKRSTEIFEAKKAALEQGDEAVARQVGEGKDIMSILMRANMVASEEDRLSEYELISQMSTMTFAGMDTTSNSLARILHMLAMHPDAQEKVREESIKARSDGDLSYDELMQLPYLDAVIRETLRLHPAVTLVIRQPTKDMVLPLSEPIRGVDGTMMHEIFIPKDTQIIPGILGSNINKAVWGPDALEWKPERWLRPLPSTVTEAPIPGIYSHLMTFSGGARGCIGFKFSEMEIKVTLSVLLSSFRFDVSQKPIVWNLATVKYPTVGRESNAAQLPLRVQSLNHTEA